MAAKQATVPAQPAPAEQKKPGVEPVDVFLVMEDIGDKLRVLGYEADFCRKKDLKPLTRSYFAIPGKASEQFPYFQALVGWLLKELKVDFLEWAEFEDPNSVSQSIMDLLKRQGFVADFPVSALRRGCGEAVCNALSFLVNKAFDSKFKMAKPTYVSGDNMADDAIPDDDTDETEFKEEIQDEYEPEAPAVFGGSSKLEEKGAPEEDKQMQQIIETKIDPVLWNIELERVGPRLKFRSDATQKEWRAHLEQSLKHEKLLQEQFPESKGALEKMTQALRQAIERISSKERQINKEFEHLGGEFRTNQKKLDEIQEEYNKLSASVAELSSELAQKTDAVDSMKAVFSDRSNAVTDTSPLRKIQAALVELRKEVVAMDLRIGVVGQTLLQSKIRHHTHQQHSAALQGGRKQSSAALAIQAAGVDEDEDPDAMSARDKKESDSVNAKVVAAASAAISAKEGGGGKRTAPAKAKAKAKVDSDDEGAGLDLDD